MYGLEALSFNVKDGYVDAVVRGHRSGLLTTADYNNLCQCETLDDIKLNLTSTDYGPYLANEPSPLHTTTVVDRCTEKLVDDWNKLRVNADEPLAKFLDYCTYGHMIDNVVLIVTGTLHERDVHELLDKCHPLGMFDSIATLAVASSMRELYRLVLVDTPLAPYFSESLSAEDLDEMNIEIMRNTLYKAYLDDFSAFCNKLGGTTADVMGNLLSFEADRSALNITLDCIGTELMRGARRKLYSNFGLLYPHEHRKLAADRRALNITLNSIGTELTRDDRRKLYSNFGLLYPHGHHELASAEDFDQIRNAMEKCPPYQALFNKLGYGESQMLDKVLYEEEVRRLTDTFEQQFHYGVFYSYMRLREQEIRNLMWISECVAQDQKSRIMDGIVFLF